MTVVYVCDPIMTAIYGYEHSELYYVRTGRRPKPNVSRVRRVTADSALAHIGGSWELRIRNWVLGMGLVQTSERQP